MREIKFRAWDKSEKCWAEGGFLINGARGKVASNMPDDYELMQFTGLYDKNGKVRPVSGITRMTPPTTTNTWIARTKKLMTSRIRF